jgi:hypothetical protein
MYDDLVTDPNNPYPGQLFNHPNCTFLRMIAGRVITYTPGSERRYDTTLAPLCSTPGLGGSIGGPISDDASH